MPLHVEELLMRINDYESGNSKCCDIVHYLNCIETYLNKNDGQRSLTGLRKYMSEFTDKEMISFTEASTIDSILFDGFDNTCWAKIFGFPFKGDIIDDKEVTSAGIFTIGVSPLLPKMSPLLLPKSVVIPKDQWEFILSLPPI